MLLLRGGRVLDPALDFEGEADVLVHEGRVRRLAPGEAPPPNVREIDAHGKWVCPGFTDLRAHLREPGEEYKEDIDTARAAAAAGGFSSICAMPGTKEPNDTRSVTELILSRAKSPGTRVLPFGTITKGMKGKELSEMAELRDAGCVGVTDDWRPVTDAGLLRRAMEYAATSRLVLMQHCEEPHLAPRAMVHESPLSTALGLPGSPAEAEAVAVARDLAIAEHTGARLHIAHVSSARAVELIREAKSRGVPVTASVTPHHLNLTEEAIRGYDTMSKVVPPLRSPADRAGLRAGLADGTLDAIATDHAPHARMDKDCEFAAAAYGISGLETAVPWLLRLVAEGVLTPRRLVEALTVGPAAVLGERALLNPTVHGGTDLVLIDPDATWTLDATSMRSKGKNSPLLGQELVGRVLLTVVDAAIVHDATQPPIDSTP